MKNVAGYDVSRLMVGAHGTLGVLLDISLKVLPRSPSSVTLARKCNATEAINSMSALLSQPFPVDAACYNDELLSIRLSGSSQAVKEARSKISGEAMPEAEKFWHALREHELSFFKKNIPLYRIMVKPATPPLQIKGAWMLDWGGAQRWLHSDEDITDIRRQVELVGGHVTVFRGDANGSEKFQPLPASSLLIHQRLKASFDPKNIFNRGRLYSAL
jgi:glycolate oxidase FAD binding subunit